MSNTQHTPGPWHISGGPISVHKYRHYDIIGGISLVATTAILSGSQHTAEESSANARLIAAAPDLLAALKFCATVLSDCVLFPERDDENQAYSWAIAAIAKAEGTNA